MAYTRSFTIILFWVLYELNETHANDYITQILIWDTELIKAQQECKQGD